MLDAVTGTEKEGESSRLFSHCFALLHDLVRSVRKFQFCPNYFRLIDCTVAIRCFPKPSFPNQRPCDERSNIRL